MSPDPSLGAIIVTTTTATAEAAQALAGRLVEVIAVAVTAASADYLAWLIDATEQS